MKITKRNISKVLEEKWFSISRSYSNGVIKWLSCSTGWVEILWDVICKHEYSYFNNYKNRTLKKSQKQTGVFWIDFVPRTLGNSKIEDYKGTMLKIYKILKENFNSVILDEEWKHYIQWLDDSMTGFKIVLWNTKLLKEDHNQIITKSF